MLKTASDSPVSDAEWKDFLKHRSFGQVVAIGAGRERPIITPTHFIYDETRELSSTFIVRIPCRPKRFWIWASSTGAEHQRITDESSAGFCIDAIS